MNVLATLLAAGTDSSSSVNDVEPGLLGFIVVAAIGLALVFLLRSMNKQFRKIGPKPEDTEAEGASAEGASAEGASAEGDSAAASQRPLRGLAAHRAAMAAADGDAATGAEPEPGNREQADANRD